MTTHRIRSLLSGLLLTFLLNPLHAQEDEERQLFEVPAGRAEETLEVFAQQSNQSTLFSIDMVWSLRTKAVKGRFTPFDALSLMLSGTNFVAALDAQTDALTINREKSEVYVAKLPPFVVEGNSQESRGIFKWNPIPAWQYVNAGDIEVLFRCSTKSAYLMIKHHFLLHQMLDVILPQEFRVRFDVPTSYVLYDHFFPPLVSQDLVDALDKQRKGTQSGSVQGMLNYRFSGRDSEAVFFVLNAMAFPRSNMGLEEDYIYSRLSKRAPSLPIWFIEGIIELYRNLDLESPPTSSTGPHGEIIFKPAIWRPDAKHSDDERNQNKPREFLAFEELFSSRPPATTDERHLELWRSQTALFIRWAFDNKSKSIEREALWRFIRNTTSGTVSEEVFKDCFGMGYATALKKLRAYLPRAMKNRFKLKPDSLYTEPRYSSNEATVGEISRIKGRLDRLGTAYVETHFPELKDKYAQQARTTLMRAHDDGDRDPRLLAELGLWECDYGDDNTAWEYLHAAVAEKIVHPRVYYELARIEFAPLRPNQPEGKLTAEQIAEVVDLLMTSLKQSPPLVEVYELISKVWMQSEVKLRPAQFDLLKEGARLFPRSIKLLYAAALLDALNQRTDEANVLISKALLVAQNEKQRLLFLNLRNAMEQDSTISNPSKPH